MVNEEIDVYVVQLVDRVSKEVLKEFEAESDYDLAMSTKDIWDIEFNDGSTYTKIEIYSQEV